MKKSAFLFCVIFLASCIAQPAPAPTSTASLPYVITQEENPYPPQTEDLGRERNEVILTSLNLFERSDLTPSRVGLDILGSMPGTCDELRVNINPPDASFQIFIEIYSIADQKLKCENVFQQVEAKILLGIYSAGRYTIWVNDKYVGDFVSL